jgi:hypothetical protein
VSVALVSDARNAQREAQFDEHRALLAQYEATLDSDPAASSEFAYQAWLQAQDMQGPLRADLEAEAEAAVRTALEADNQRLVRDAGRGDFETSEFSPTVLTC